MKEWYKVNPIERDLALNPSHLRKEMIE